VLFHGRPYGDLSGVRQQVLNNGRLFAGFFDFEQRLSRNPAVGNGFVPRLRIFTLADDHVESVIFQIQRLSGALNAVSDHCDGFVLQHFERFAQGELFTCGHVLHNSPEIHFCHDFLFLKIDL